MKNSKATQVWIDSIIPLGMIIGAAIGIMYGALFKPEFLVYAVIIGAGAGYLIGVIAYVIFRLKEKS